MSVPAKPPLNAPVGLLHLPALEADAIVVLARLDYQLERLQSVPLATLGAELEKFSGTMLVILEDFLHLRCGETEPLWTPDETRRAARLQHEIAGRHAQSVWREFVGDSTAHHTYTGWAELGELYCHLALRAMRQIGYHLPSSTRSNWRASCLAFETRLAQVWARAGEAL